MNAKSILTQSSEEREPFPQGLTSDLTTILKVLAHPLQRKVLIEMATVKSGTARMVADRLEVSIQSVQSAIRALRSVGLLARDEDSAQSATSRSVFYRLSDCVQVKIAPSFITLTMMHRNHEVAEIKLRRMKITTK